MSSQNVNLTTGNIKKELFNLSWPMLFGIMGMVIFSLVDTFFIAKLGVEELAALGFCLPVMMIVMSFAGGIGIGTNSLIARNIRVASRDNVKRMSSRAILLAIIIGSIAATIGLFTIIPLFSFLGAKSEVLKHIYNYMIIWYFAVPLVIIPMIGNNIIRGLGNTFLPGMILAVSAVVNLTLDPLLIFGVGPFPELGMKGAALATVISRGIDLVIVLMILINKENIVTINLGKIREILVTWKKVFYIALPATLEGLITPISIGIITKILAGFGHEVVAAFGICSRIEMLVLSVIFSLGTVLIIFMGQNISKQKFNRIFQSLNYSLKFSLMWGILIFFLLWIFDPEIASIFTTHKKVIEITEYYFLIIGPSYGFLGLLLLSDAAFNGINKPYEAVIFALARMVGLYVPLALVGAKLFGVNGVFWAGFIANVLIGIFAYYFLFRTIRKLKS